MSVIARRFAACPARTATDTWEAIVEVIAAGAESVQQQLNNITGVMASIISDETPSKSPITVIGSGPRLRIYCLYGDDAIGDDKNEAALTWDPFENEWEIHFPVEEVDFAWVTSMLKEKNTRFKTYKTGEKIIEEKSNDKAESTSNFSQLSINIDKLK